MFKVVISWVLFIGAIIMDVWMIQDFKPKYLIVIIGVTVFTGLLTWFNTKALIENIEYNRRKETQASKTNTDSSYAGSFCIRDKDGTLWNLSCVDKGDKNDSANDSPYMGRNLFKKTSPEDKDID